MPAFPYATSDPLARQITLDAPPERIVSLVPSLTDLLAHLDLGDRVVGVTRFCERPEGWREQKTIVGGTKQVKIDTVRELAPDLILANKEENTPGDVEALDAIAPVYVTDVGTVEEATVMIRAVGRLTGRAEAADDLADTIAARFDALPDAGAASAAEDPSSPAKAPETVRAAYLIWRTPYMTVGGDTFIHDVMTRGGFANPFADRTRYPEVTPEELGALDLDVLLCSSEPFPFHQKEAFTADLRAACPDTPLEIVDGQLFSWYGPRLLKTPDYLQDLRARIAAARPEA
jgi:ABC-type Fe3+-hydroxamate transport system substrate-binding protein